MRIKVMIALLLIISMLACEKKNPMSFEANGVETLSMEGGSDAVFSASDPAAIEEAEIVGDILILKVVYSGGCDRGIVTGIETV